MAETLGRVEGHIEERTSRRCGSQQRRRRDGDTEGDGAGTSVAATPPLRLRTAARALTSVAGRRSERRPHRALPAGGALPRSSAAGAPCGSHQPARDNRRPPQRAPNVLTPRFRVQLASVSGTISRTPPSRVFATRSDLGVLAPRGGTVNGQWDLPGLVRGRTFPEVKGAATQLGRRASRPHRRKVSSGLESVYEHRAGETAQWATGTITVRSSRC